MSDTDTLIGSPTVEHDEDGKFRLRKINEDDEQYNSDDDDENEYETGRRTTDSECAERLISKMPQGVDSVGYGGAEKKGWGFWELMRYRPVQILNTTMFLNA